MACHELISESLSAPEVLWAQLVTWFPISPVDVVFKQC